MVIEHSHGTWPIEIDALPIKNGWIFPWQTLSHNQMVVGFYDPTVTGWW